MSQKPNPDFKSHSELFSLSGKTAAVIGGGGHVCSALARGFASAGANVAIIDLRIEKAESVAKEISNDFGVRAIGIYADATKLDELNETYNKELEEYRVLKEYFDKAYHNHSTCPRSALIFRLPVLSYR
jgi:NAD(P)-dependent dehydrogenase (short-subunit alcohol dehydrogenase family)